MDHNAGNQVPDNALVVTLDDEYVGNIILEYSADWSYLLRPQQQSVGIDARLHVRSTSQSVASTARVAPQISVNPSVKGHTTEVSSNNHAGLETQEEDKDDDGVAPPQATSTKPRKTRRVADNAPPIQAKSANYYVKAITEPAGMVKEEGASCLTCLRFSRKCHGTGIVLVKGEKRCTTCAKPGKGTGGRRCFWKDPGNNVNTYEEAKAFKGAWSLPANTRKGIQERQSKKEAVEEEDKDDDNDNDDNDEDDDGDEFMGFE